MTENTGKDNLYARPYTEISNFEFNKKVVDVFPDMLQRSVPGYNTIIPLIGIMAGRYAQAESNCYDLGCSIGTVTLSMRRMIQKKNCRIIAVDNSYAMVDRCLENIKETSEQIPVDVICDDILNINVTSASVVILNFTLQFIETEKRLGLLSRIYEGLLPGGILILSEKINFSELPKLHFHEKMHRLFKKANGYSDLEISQKRTALEKVLQPESLEKHHNRLYKVGFTFTDVWFQCFNFASILAQK